MKNLTPIRLVALVLLMFMFSCRKESFNAGNDNLPAISQGLLSDVNFVPLPMARSAAVQATVSPFTKKLFSEKPVNSAQQQISPKAIQSETPLPDGANPSYYVFNYVGGGYSIIAADKRVEPVLAYSDKGGFATSGALPPGLKHWLTINDKNMKLLRTKPDLKQPAGEAQSWKELLVNYNSGSTSNHLLRLPPDPGPCHDTIIYFAVGPLLATQWGQGYPYNQSCPAGSYSGGHTPTGCVATAMAQVMYYWQYPSYFNWSNMPLGPTFSTNSDLDGLMSSIGSSVNMQYHDSGSFPYYYWFTGSPGPTLKFFYGYGSASNETSFYYNTYSYVMNNIDGGRPVLLAGDDGSEGHEWVCDGYEEYTYSYCPSTDFPYGWGETYLLFHMNWGWNELGVTNNENGWYYYDVWQVFINGGLDNFQYNQRMTYDIHP